MGGELIRLHSSTAPGAAQHLASMGISLSIAHKVGGTVSGCRIARSICRGVPLGPADLLGMFRWFARHTPPPKVDFDAPTHEAVEWLLRGGYPGRSWVRRQMVAATPPSLGWLSLWLGFWPVPRLVPRVVHGLVHWGRPTNVDDNLHP